MSRARNIKPGFFKNEDLAECSFAARLCFPGLWMLADREGRLEDRPKRIKGELFAFDSIEVEPLLCELADHGFLVRYQIEGAKFIQISKFLAHQTPHYSEKQSVIKPPPLQELNGHDAASNPGVNQDYTEKDDASRGGRNPLNPDFLNPDSLNHDSVKEQDTPLPAVATPAEKAHRAIPQKCPADVDAQVWADWLALRKAKHAPVTATTVKTARSEADKAGLSIEAFLQVWCGRGSQGLEASWLKANELNAARAANGTYGMTFKERDEANAIEKVRRMTGGLAQAKPASFKPFIDEVSDAPKRLD